MNRWPRIVSAGVALFLFAILGAAGTASAQTYDLLLKGAHVIDPANEIDGVRDVGVKGNRIAKVAENLDPADATKTVDLAGLYVTPGLVDLHAHPYLCNSGSLFPDDTWLTTGTTTIVACGDAGWRNFDDFKTTIIDRSLTRVLAFINIVGRGIAGMEAEHDLSDMEPEKTAAKINEYPDLIVGIKTAHYEPPDWKAVDSAVEAAEKSNTVLMVDFRPKPDRDYPELILEHMRPGDLHTHMYSRNFSWLDENKKVKSYMWAARKRGVLFDVGHGNGSFYFRIAVPAIKAGFLPDTISTDIHKRSIMLPRANMATTTTVRL